MEFRVAFSSKSFRFFRRRRSMNHSVTVMMASTASTPIAIPAIAPPDMDEPDLGGAADVTARVAAGSVSVTSPFGHAPVVW